MQKKFQKNNYEFLKNAQVLNKATQGELFFQKQLKPMGYYSARKSKQFDSHPQQQPKFRHL